MVGWKFCSLRSGSTLSLVGTYPNQKRTSGRVRTGRIVMFKSYAATVLTIVYFFIFVEFFGSRDKVGVCSSIRGDRVDAC